MPLPTATVTFDTAEGQKIRVIVVARGLSEERSEDPPSSKTSTSPTSPPPHPPHPPYSPYPPYPPYPPQ